MCQIIFLNVTYLRNGLKLYLIMGTTLQNWMKKNKAIVIAVIVFSIMFYSLLWSYAYWSNKSLIEVCLKLNSNLYDNSVSTTDGNLTTIREELLNKESHREGKHNIEQSETVLIEAINTTGELMNQQTMTDPFAILMSLAETATRNLPLDFLDKHASKSINLNNSCANLPAYYDINFNNIYWQYFPTSNGTFYLYSSYHDVRKEPQSFVRVIGMFERVDPSVETYCQLWFEELSKPVISKVSQYKYLWLKAWGNAAPGILQPYIISCEVPESDRDKVPVAVSLVEHICDMPNNIIKITGKRNDTGTKEDFAVCLKTLFYQYTDISIQLLEWLEILFALGANKVYIYVFAVHPNVLKVIQYYENLGKIVVTPLTLPESMPNFPTIYQKYFKNKLSRQTHSEVIQYNDCYYRNLYQHKYIVIQDIDEIIMPRIATSWKQLLKTTHEKYNAMEKTSFCARNVYFFDQHKENKDCDGDIPCYLHFLRTKRRSVNYTKAGNFEKCFHSTDQVLALHNHYPLACLSYCKPFEFNTEEAHLQHYRSDCHYKPSCQSTFKDHMVEDNDLLRFKEQLLNNIPKIVNELNLI